MVKDEIREFACLFSKVLHQDRASEFDCLVANACRRQFRGFLFNRDIKGDQLGETDVTVKPRHRIEYEYVLLGLRTQK